MSRKEETLRPASGFTFVVEEEEPVTIEARPAEKPEAEKAPEEMTDEEWESSARAVPPADGDDSDDDTDTEVVGTLVKQDEGSDEDEGITGEPAVVVAKRRGRPPGSKNKKAAVAAVTGPPAVAETRIKATALKKEPRRRSSIEGGGVKAQAQVSKAAFDMIQKEADARKVPVSHVIRDALHRHFGVKE